MMLFTFFIFLSSSAYSFENDMFVKGGVAITQAKVEALNGSDDKFFGTGFNTHFGYRWEEWEASLSSYIYWGNIDNLEFQANGQTIEGTGSYRHVSFGPVIKYTSRKWELFRNWHLYTGLGPVWSLQTIKLKRFTTTGNFSSDRKITYQSFGGMVVLGIEENLPFKEMHPVYIEFVYSYKKSQKVSIVDTSNTQETNILSTEDAKQDVEGNFFMLSFGMTIF